MKKRKNYLDLKGRQFGRLTAIEPVAAENRKKVWRCRCDCGNEVNVRSTSLTSGNTKSCGCLVGKHLSTKTREKLLVDDVFTPILKSKLREDNTTGYKGVHKRVYLSGNVKYTAHISIKGKQHHLGTFDTAEEAYEARKKGEEKYHLPYLKESDTKKENEK